MTEKEIINEKEIKDMKFEDAMARLEAIVGDLEKGSCDLDSSLELFEEGLSLVRICSDKLEKASQKVKLLTSDGEKDFDDQSAGEQ